MVSLLDLWLPIGVSGILVFVAGFLAWVVLPHHKGDWASLPDEERFYESLRSMGIKAGSYMFPWCHGVEKAEMHEKYAKGPWGQFYLLDKQPNYMMNLLKVFGFDVLVGLLVAYVATMTISAGADGMHVFRVTGTVAVMAHCLGGFPMDVFTGKKTGAIVATFADGLVYGLVTGAIFALMWPDGATMAV